MKRDEKGRFLKKKPLDPLPLPDVSGGTAMRTHFPTDRYLHRKICEECGQEFEYRTIIVGGKVLHLGACPKCTPDPMSPWRE